MKNKGDDKSNFLTQNALKLVFLLLGGILAFLSFKHHDDHPYGHWRNAFWADKSGYYSYLPYILEKDFADYYHADSLRAKVGHGFKVKEGRMINKYPLGVALLQAPFYLTGRLVDAAEDPSRLASPRAAFQGWRAWFTVLSAPFYVTLGLYLLYLSWRSAFPQHQAWRVALAVISIIPFTSLLYYTVIEGMMSHSYSFFLLSSYIFLLGQLYRGPHRRHYLLLGLTVGLILLVRPFNLLLLGLYPLALAPMLGWNLHGRGPMLRGALLAGFLGAVILAIPQLAYYKHAFGSWLTYSYGEEGFNWTRPELLKVLASPKQGLYIYLPILGLWSLWLFRKLFQSPPRFLPLAGAMLLISYIYSCWHMWYYGCGYGIRVYVEWLPLLALSLGYFRWPRHRGLQISLLVLLLLVALYTIRMTYAWSGCWFSDEISFAKYLDKFWS